MHDMQEFNGRHLDEAVAFIAVVERGSFTGAGEALQRDASVVSRRVTALEQRLGVRLLQRTTRQVHVTEAGTTLYQRLRAAAAAMQEAERAASAAGAAAHGLLRLSLPGTFGRLWIAPLLPQFLAAHPGVRIEASYTDRNVDIVGEGYDAAIRIGELPDSSLIARRLAPHRRLLCAAPRYLRMHGIPAQPEDLARHACLGFSRIASHPEWRLNRGGEIRGVRIAGPLVADDNHSLLIAARAGLGIMLSADWLTVPELRSGELVPVLPQWSGEGQGAIHLLHPSARFVPGKTRAFVDWIAARLTPPPWLDEADEWLRDASRVGS